MKELERKQECERWFLEKLLQEEQASALLDKTHKKSKESRKERLTELKVRKKAYSVGGFNPLVYMYCVHNSIVISRLS